MNKQIDLVWLGDTEGVPAWRRGELWTVAPVPHAINALIQDKLAHSAANAWLFWHPSVGTPEVETIDRVLNLPGNLWHAGLRQNMGSLPKLIDFVSSTWMLNRDADSAIEATSWRLSLRACLLEIDVLRQMGGVNPDFQTLEGASLEMGLRYITRGVFTRYVPWLVPGQTAAVPSVSIEDELRLVYYRFNRFWANWALIRAVLSAYVTPRRALVAWRHVCSAPRPIESKPYRHSVQFPETDRLKQARVTVLIPTVDRYPYLRKLLSQLGEQSVKPYEIIIIDQTERPRRDTSLVKDFASLPVKMICLDKAGQCSSRNAGLQMAQGDYILFIDDDDEVRPDLIESHLRIMQAFHVDVSSGVAQEVGSGALPENFTYTRVSDVFPTNNTLIQREVLQRTGLFDLAYERMPRADGDLGMRVYLTGVFMLLSPEISVLHHHAPSGGLRKHKARVITYASSRNTLWQRNLPSVSEIYLGMRYFTRRQVQEGLWLSIFGTFAIHGSRFRKLLKLGISAILLPHTVLWIVRARWSALNMLQHYPQIPALESSLVEKP